MPDTVINPNNHKLTKPKQLDPEILSNSILFLSKNKRLRLRYGLHLYQHVKKRFRGIEEIYEQF